MSRVPRARTIVVVGVGWVAAGLVLAAGCARPQRSSRTQEPTSPAPDDAPLACTPIRASGEAPLIDDFEAVPGQLPGNDGRGGWWFSYDDGTGGQLRREEIALGGGGEAGHALHVVASGFAKWGAGFGASLHPGTTRARGCPYDASAYAGLRVRARGRGRVRLSLGDAATTPVARGGRCARPGEGCFDLPGVWLLLEERWQTFELPFCAFSPEGWGGSSDRVDPSTLVDLHFRVGTRAAVELWLDDLAFYRAAPGAPAPRCERPCPLDLVPRTADIDPTHTTATLTEELGVHTFEQPTTSCGPLTRRYLSFVPRRLPPRSSAPVLFVLHGRGGNADWTRSHQTRARFDALATRDGFVVVYGNAAPGAQTNPLVPNSGAWRQAHFRDGEVDDVDYLERVLADLAARGVIDGTNPVLLAGLSNGGGMALEAARRIPGRLRGVAALMPYDGYPPEPVPDLTGTRLERVLIAYTHGDPAMPDGYHETMALQPARWAAAMGLPAAVIAAPQRTALPDRIVEGEGYRGTRPVALATRDRHVTQLDLVGPDGRRRVRVLIMDHAGHFWPNPVQFNEEWVLTQYGFRNQDFDAADAVWDFLRPPAT